MDRPSLTALTATTARAAWYGRLANDSFAWRFLGRGLRAIAWLLRHVPLLLALAVRIGDWIERGVGAYIGLRTAYIDDAVEAAAASGISQIVILGAGYDSRAWRLAHPGVRYFEIDHPATQARKQARLAQLALPAQAVMIPVDFAVDDLASALVAGGFDRDRPALFVWEGVSMFLSPAAVRATVAAVRGLACGGSRFVADFNYPKRDTVGCAAARALGEACRFSLAPAMAAAFLELEVTELAGAELLRERYLQGSRFARRHRTQPSFLVTASVGE
ncbi:MAG: class I SAM-dependent methyltransferase [Kofleriaceae bacterium]